MTGRIAKPLLVAHADWGSDPRKRWMALAQLQPGGAYWVATPRPVGALDRFLASLRHLAGLGETVLVGLDFPIGLPNHYAKQVDIRDFLDWLPHLGRGEWAQFFQVAGTPEEIGLQRPFYPAKPGTARQEHLLNKLNAGSIGDLRRVCELPRPGRRAASPLFWTLGGQQVGKAAISGWRDLLLPALSQATNAAIWPFSGRLEELLQPGELVFVESYPAEFYTHLGVQFSRARKGQRSGKRVQAERAANAPTLLAWAAAASVRLDAKLAQEITDGFGRGGDGEDRFDALVGLLGMLDVLLGNFPLQEPQEEIIRRVEGWIFGQILPE